ncbi:MAG: beta-N-acetylhexosaminidase, partial [Bacteroidota bacterium]|nr:beta-N-acetylhexosaminidase [Bacteroidota bacterium]
SIQENYTIDGKKITWTGPYYGGTIHIRHFFGFPSYFSEKQGTVYATTNVWSPKNQKVDCWIGFHDWSRSGGRRGGPFPQQGQWHNTSPRVWVNGKNIEPPVWKNPGLAEKTEEISFSDENYSFRKPTKISLKKGWNEVLLKVPQGGTSWKWMFTFVPVRIENEQVKEIKGLKFSVDK